MLTLASQKIVDNFNDAFFAITLACVILMVGIMAAMVYFAVKYHRSKHPKPARISGSLKLEITWTIIPTLIALWMFWVGYVGFNELRTVPDGAYVVHVTGKQWSWTFEHEKSGVTDSVLKVPVGVPIHCKLSSPVDDVLHSFYIPDFKVKEDCVPGLDTYLWFQADKVGEKHTIFCAEFCGNDHAKMWTHIEVLSQEDFDAYLLEKAKARYAPVTDPAHVATADTEQLKEFVPDVKGIYATYCQSCHGANGEGGLVEGARSFRDDPVSKWKKGVKISEIFKTITEGLPGTRMNAFDTLSAWERFALSHYVAGFYKDGPGRSKNTPEEIQALIKERQLDVQRDIVMELPVDEAMKTMAVDGKDDENK